MKTRVLLVAESPVAGTILRFDEALNRSEQFSSFPFVLRGYKSGAFDLPVGAMGVFANWSDLLAQKVSTADVVVLHNVAQQSIVDLTFASKRKGCSVFYHLHSPPFEPPLYAFDILSANKFDAVFCVAQGHSRFCEGATPIANIIEDPFLIDGVQRRSSVMVGHLRTTGARWSRKVPDKFAGTLEGRLGPDGVEVFTTERLFGLETVPHKMFIQALQGFDYMVDDICSGLFHQSSMEALKAGCVVFTAADKTSLDSFSVAADCPEPPFEIVSDPMEVADRVRHYSRSPSLLEKRRTDALRYGEQYLRKSRLGSIFVSRLSSFAA
jgi:hypothetical protein